MAKFRVEDTPPCQYCTTCPVLVKRGIKPCPYHTDPYTFTDYTLQYILHNEFKRLDDDDTEYEIRFGDSTTNKKTTI